MAKKKNKIEKLEVESVVVGAGPAGLAAFQKERRAGRRCILLEAAPSLGGRSKRALHLVDADQADSYSVMTAALLDPMKIRWEREWLCYDQVDWSSKEWLVNLPQWKSLGTRLKTVVLEMAEHILPELDTEEAVEKEVFLSSPVNSIALNEGVWELHIPDYTISSPKVVWAAGLKPFQNAYGKNETQKILVANPDYDMDAADFQGGIAYDLELPFAPNFAENFPQDALFAVPTRFEGKFYLMLGVYLEVGGRFLIKTLTHVPQDMLTEPKQMTTFQKALKRSLKSILAESETDILDNSKEQWTLSDRIVGHSKGMISLLPRQVMNGLLFVGDEVEGLRNRDTLGALESVHV